MAVRCRGEPSFLCDPELGRGYSSCVGPCPFWLVITAKLLRCEPCAAWSRTAVQAECRTKRSLSYAEAQPAIAAEQQPKYAPAPHCGSTPRILAVLTRQRDRHKNLLAKRPINALSIFARLYSIQFFRPQNHTTVKEIPPANKKNVPTHFPHLRTFKT